MEGTAQHAARARSVDKAVVYSSRTAWWKGALRTAGSFTALAVVWEILARTVIQNRLVLVPFTEVMSALAAEIRSGEFWRHTWVTFQEIAIGFPISVGLGIAIGLLLSQSYVLQQMLAPVLTAMYSVPIVALAPLFISWLGFGLDSKVAIIMLTTVFPVIINTEVGLRSTDRALIEAARSFNATKWQIFQHVTFPFAIPFIIGGVRVAFARALVGVIVAEFFGSYAGYGYAILAASQTFQTDRLLAYVVVLGIVGMLGSVGLQAWERKLAPWREGGS